MANLDLKSWDRTSSTRPRAFTFATWIAVFYLPKILTPSDFLNSHSFHVFQLTRPDAMATDGRPYQPSLPWRMTSALNIGIVGFLSRSFLLGLNRIETHGLDRFQDVLDSRRDEKDRTRGLITGGNCVPSSFGVARSADMRGSLKPCEHVGMLTTFHINTSTLRKWCRLDDPLVWGVLPYRYFWNPNNMRWSLGSYDICFKNRCAEDLTITRSCSNDTVTGCSRLSSAMAILFQRIARHTRSMEVSSSPL